MAVDISACVLCLIFQRQWFVACPREIKLVYVRDKFKFSTCFVIPECFPDRNIRGQVYREFKNKKYQNVIPECLYWGLE